MSRTADKPADVFLSHAAVDTGLTEGVVRSFEAAGLVVFPAAGLGSDAGQVAETRRRMQESLAFVALLTPSLAREKTLAIEVGAAWAGAMPVYLLLSELRKAEVPAYLRGYPAFPLWSGLEVVVEAVRTDAESLSGEERAALARAYQELGVPVDQLVTSPAAGERLAEAFAARADRTPRPGRLVRELLRLRKAGKLPRLVQKTAG